MNGKGKAYTDNNKISSSTKQHEFLTSDFHPEKTLLVKEKNP